MFISRAKGLKSQKIGDLIYIAAEASNRPSTNFLRVMFRHSDIQVLYPVYR